MTELKKTRARRPWKKALKIAALALTLLLLTVAGLFIWLGTSSGARFVYRQTAKILAADGFELTVGQIEGPLPGRLLVRDALFSDARGPLARAGLLEVELAPTALLRGLAHLPLIRIENPELLRVPAPAEPGEEESGPFSLPVAVRVDRLDLNGGRVQAGALAALGLENPELLFSVGGQARLEPGLTALDLETLVSEADGGRLLGLTAKVGGGTRLEPADRLELDLKISDRPGGFLSKLLADPQWSGLNLEFKGAGPLNDWRGRLDLSTAALGDLKAELVFRGQSGLIWYDLVAGQAWLADLRAELASPVHLATGLQLAAAVSRQGADLRADLSAESAGEPALALAGRLSGSLKPGGGDFQFDSTLNGLGGFSGDEQPLTLSAKFNLDRQSQKVDDLKLNGAGLSLSGAARRHLDSGAVQGDLDLNLADGSPLLKELLRLAGLGEDDFGGSLRIGGDLDWRGPLEAAAGHFQVEGRNMRWPDRRWEQLLGPALDITAGLSGGAGEALTLLIRDAGAGLLSLNGQIDCRPAGSLAHSEFQADLQAALGDVNPLAADLAGPLDLRLTGSGRLDRLRAGLDLASPGLRAAPGTVSGLKLRLEAAGGLFRDSGSELNPDLSGNLEFSAEDSPGGPLAFKSDWLFRQDGPDLSLAASNIDGQLAGLLLGGDFRADLPGGGRPRLGGGLRAEVDDWSRLAALTGQPLAGSPARLSLRLEAPEGRQSAEADLDLPSLKLGRGREESLSLKAARLNLKADDIFEALDLDLDFRLGAGLAGPLSWGGGEVRAAGRGGRGDFAAELKNARLAGAGGQGRDGLNLAGTYALGREPEVQLKRLELGVAKSGLSLKEPLTVSLGANLKISPFSAVFRPAGQMSAEVDLSPGAMKIKADLKKVPYSFFKAFAGLDLPDGEIQNLRLDLDQSGGGLAGDFELQTQASPRELKNIQPGLALQGRLKAGASPALELEGRISGGANWKAQGDLSARLPLSQGTDGAFPVPDYQAPLAAKVKFVGPVGPLWGLLGQPDRSLTGLAQIDAELGGTLSRPLPRGTAYLAGGRFEDQLWGVLVNDIQVEAHSSPELPLKALVSAKDGRSGGLALEAQVRDLNHPDISAKGRLSRFSPVHRDDLVVFVSGDFGAEGPLDRLSLSSDLTVDRGELDLKIVQSANSIPTLTSSRPDGRAGGAGADRGRLGLKIKIPNQFFIRGYGLESEWRGELNIGGSADRPSLVGQLAPVRGYFEIFSKEFQFTGGQIALNGGANPSLNLELTNNGPNIAAIARITGTARKPGLSLESRPPLPQDEVLAQVLFGKSASGLSPFEAIQLAGAVNELRSFGQGGVSVIGRLRGATGLDVLRVGGTDNDRERRASSLSGSLGREMAGGPSGGGGQSDDLAVEAGKYISDSIYVGVEHSGLAGAAVRVEVELAPSISFEARTSAESSRFGVGWKKDY
ncbi:MAG: translocation/assembly module TamB domain-containing protein [Candidatus Adiutrix sp.]|jgi:translocation and assembly module TamB|nr:translocation/assembly module TamB domain-containing protein [Candidatus Adiutrix sp.]